MRRLSLPVIVSALALALAASAGATVHRGSLKIEYWAQGVSGPSTTWTLRCGTSVAGTHPARRLACSALARHSADLIGPAKVCTLMPSLRAPRAKVTGTYAGRRVSRTFRSGCPGWSDLKVLLTGKSS